MKVSGYQLREAIKQHELRRDVASKTYNSSLKAFKDEDKQSPQVIVTEFLEAERAIAELQTAQMRYNLTVEVEFPYDSPEQRNGVRAPLGFFIKLVGSLARAEKMYRSAATGKEDRYSLRDDVRNANEETAKPTISPSQAVEQAAVYAKKAGQVRAAIATANATEIEIKDLNPSLF